MSDKETVELLIADDPDAVREFFFVRCRPALTYIGQYFCGGKLSAEEMIGEFYEFLSADSWHKLRIFRYSCSLNSYITVIASRYFQRKRNRDNILIDDNISPLMLDGICTTEMEDRSLMRIVGLVIGRMPVLDRVLLNRILLDGERPRDIIPEVLSYISDGGPQTRTKEQLAGYVYTRYNRAKVRLQKALVELGYCG